MLARAIAAGETRTVWCIADRQTNGVGRRARPWRSSEKNFTGSLLCWPDWPPLMLAQSSFAAALSVRDCLQDLSHGKCDARLKWPNDVYANGKKISGILLSTHRAATGTGLIIGIGINLVDAPSAQDDPDMNVPAVALVDYLQGSKPTPMDCFQVLARRLAFWLTKMDTDGFDPIRTAWLDRAMGLGEPIVARLPNATHRGAFEGIDQTGALQLNSENGLVTIPAGDVYFSPAQGAP